MPKLRLDETDLTLLSLLRQDAWLSIKELAASVSLSASAVHDRVKRLQSEGVIQGARADINMEALGFGIDVLVMIEFGQHDKDVIAALIDELSVAAEVQAVYFLSGETDLVRRPLGVPRRKVESTLFSPILFSMVAGGWLGHPSQASRPRLQPARTQAFFPDGRCAA